LCDFEADGGLVDETSLGARVHLPAEVSFMSHFTSGAGAALLAALACASPLQAGGSPENALLVIDPTNPVSLHVGNYYRAARSIPAANVVYFSPNPGAYTTFADNTHYAFFGTLENQAIADHIDYVILTPGTEFFVAAAGLVSDACSPVNRFAATAPFTLAFHREVILPGTNSQISNGYFAADNTAIGFDSGTPWAGGSPNLAVGRRYFIGAMLGYDGTLGNTLPEILAMIDRSVAVDGTHPAGTFYFMQTTDLARSGPRHGAYPAAAQALTNLGFAAQHLFANLPPAGTSPLGIMTGLADPLIDTTAFNLVPGAFCDHLTSFAATFDIPSQTKLSRWIAKGASGSSGTVEEPCNYAGKFPHARMHVHYAQGLSLGEAWLRSLGYAPFQQLFVGDPLTRPFAHIPSVDLSGVPAGPAAGTLAFQPSATTTHPTAQIGGFELLVDGVAYAQAGPGGTLTFETTAFADGWHELRLLAFDDSSVKSTGRWIGAIEIDNHARAASLSANVSSGELSTRFEFSAAGSGASVSELRLLQGGRVVAASSTSPATLAVFGRTLGAARSRLQLEVQFSDGLLARSAPIEIEVSGTSSTPSGAAPLAFSYTKRLRNDQVGIVELPATFDDALSDGAWTLIGAPANAVILLPTSAPYRFVRPNPGAQGSDSLTFQVTTPSGTSAVATVTLTYEGPVVCTPPVNYCTATPNSTGQPGLMTALGEPSIGTNRFTVGAYQLPPGTNGLFFYGSGKAQLPFGNGFRCVALPVLRIGVRPVSVLGDAAVAIDFTQAPFASGPGAITSGSTKYFQLWYRNPAGGGAGFNLTDGLAVTFCP
jgi:hypothetical protein